MIIFFTNICAVPWDPDIAAPGVQLKGDVLRWVANGNIRKVTPLGPIVTDDFLICCFATTSQVWLRMTTLDGPLDDLGLCNAPCRNQ